MIQLLLLLCFTVLLAAPVLLLLSIVRFLIDRSHVRSLIVLAFFHIGAVLAGWGVWQVRPPGWALPFWTTFKAGFDAQTYGHVVEHAAEVLMADLIFVSVFVGLIAAGASLAVLKRSSAARA